MKQRKTKEKERVNTLPDPRTTPHKRKRIGSKELTREQRQRS
jgi:hypothetical protein